MALDDVALKRMFALQEENSKLTAQLEAMQKEIELYNSRMASVPSLAEPPQSAPQGLRFLADWFDAVYDDAKDGKDGVQRDLRKWADEFEAAQTQLQIEKLAREDAAALGEVAKALEVK